MKHLILFTVLTVAVIGGLGVAVSAHNGSAHQLSLQNARAAAQRAKAVLNERLDIARQIDALEAKLSKSHDNCLKGLSAYNNLTKFAQSHMAKPDCTVQ